MTGGMVKRANCFTDGAQSPTGRLQASSNSAPTPIVTSTSTNVTPGTIMRDSGVRPVRTLPPPGDTVAGRGSRRRWRRPL